ncbi:hypothetical protein LZ30DRAFT_251839 [Colletotrichum cereale]|nr:hypothetical protein LZ30DRAFT_251839 [Colletotrichum cereale]
MPYFAFFFSFLPCVSWIPDARRAAGRLGFEDVACATHTAPSTSKVPLGLGDVAHAHTIFSLEKRHLSTYPRQTDRQVSAAASEAIAMRDGVARKGPSWPIVLIPGVAHGIREQHTLMASNHDQLTEARYRKLVVCQNQPTAILGRAGQDVDRKTAPPELRSSDERIAGCYPRCSSLLACTQVGTWASRQSAPVSNAGGAGWRRAAMASSIPHPPPRHRSPCLAPIPSAQG